MIAKMNKTEISAKILKREKIEVLIIKITPRAFQFFPLNQTWNKFMKRFML